MFAKSQDKSDEPTYEKLNLVSQDLKDYIGYLVESGMKRDVVYLAELQKYGGNEVKLIEDAVMYLKSQFEAEDVAEKLSSFYRVPEKLKNKEGVNE